MRMRLGSPTSKRALRPCVGALCRVDPDDSSCDPVPCEGQTAGEKATRTLSVAVRR